MCLCVVSVCRVYLCGVGVSSVSVWCWCAVCICVVSVCRVYLCGVGAPCVSVWCLCAVCICVVSVCRVYLCGVGAPCVPVWSWCALCICVWVHSLGLFNAESPPERYWLCPSHGAAAVVSRGGQELLVICTLKMPGSGDSPFNGPLTALTLEAC